MTASVVLFDGRASLLDQGRVVTLDAARRRSRTVRLLRMVLLAAMAALAASVGFFIISSAINPPLAIDPSDVGGQVRMINPRFNGRDSGGTPYVISAQSAERQGVGAAPTELVFPRLDFSGEDSPASIVQAERGVYDQVARTLDLHDGVRFRTDNGYVFETEHARVFVDEGRVVGERMILGEGPMGSIRAQAFEITDGGDSVVFRNEVVARLYVDRADNPADDAAAPAEEDSGAETPLELRGGAADDGAEAAEETVPSPADETDAP